MYVYHMCFILIYSFVLCQMVANMYSC